jgi:hypothetical protein
LTSRRGITADDWADLVPSVSSRAAIATMFALFLLSDLGAGWLHMTALTGFGFAAVSAAAAGCTRRHELLLVATTPPLLFLVAVTCGELITLHLDHVAASAGTVLAGIFLTLSSAAPWLFGGLGGALVIACVRGLPQCVRDLRAEISGQLSPSSTGTAPRHRQVTR